MKSNTATETIAGITSTGRTGVSRQPGDILELGKAIVRQLGAEKSNDILISWMAHHIAELIDVAERANGQNSSAAHDRCFQAILELWKYRASIPGESRPLAAFDEVVQLLNHLSNRDRFHYFSPPERRATGKAGQWVELAKAVDVGARAIIRFSIAQASELAAKSEKHWIKKSRMDGVTGEEDFEVALHLTERAAWLLKNTARNQEYRVDELKSLSKDVDKLLSASKTLAPAIRVIFVKAKKEMDVGKVKGSLAGKKTASKRAKTKSAKPRSTRKSR